MASSNHTNRRREYPEHMPWLDQALRPECFDILARAQNAPSAGSDSSTTRPYSGRWFEQLTYRSGEKRHPRSLTRALPAIPLDEFAVSYTHLTLPTSDL